jgi:phosphatase NudJ
MAKEPIPTWFFVLVVVRRASEFLVIREAKYAQGWYLPAGRVELGESFEDAAHRETMEEAGIPIVLEGILTVQHTPNVSNARVRVLFVARAADEAAPLKSHADEHSIEARWVTLEELQLLALRGPEVIDIFRWVAHGAPVYPLEMIGNEDRRR